MGVLSRLWPSFLCAYGLQTGPSPFLSSSSLTSQPSPPPGGETACAALFVPHQTEKYYDFCGSLGFLSTTLVSLYPSLRASSFSLRNLTSLDLGLAPRQLLLTGALVLWTTRLGTFLLQRALKAGGDSRFEEIRTQPARFTFFWVAQGVYPYLYPPL